MEGSDIGMTCRGKLFSNVMLKNDEDFDQFESLDNVAEYIPIIGN